MVEDTPIVGQVFPPSDDVIRLPSSPFTADGARLMVPPDRRSWSVVDTMTGSTLFRLNHAVDIQDDMEWSADGRTAIFVAEENAAYVYWIWNIEEGTTKAVFRWPDGRKFGKSGISADGSMVGFSNGLGDVVFRRVIDLTASALDP
ncbi:uncharacterized protein BXZ73DRAFT_99833 [Epithele typhae]|uniref:uncharacterized protein n=1 Tax=Epithele typhae TaxID=378194 RepID=UPI002007F694|nr:uncharacterized protein BXZ73DRAFT_99833 [Epithele typhae]KAH9938771.1 hypothetical protein BXZ73DRAFT_99833 [Epithele typhae]